jgi:hypothetical protein
MNLKDAMAADAAVFANPDEFGEQAVYSEDGETYNIVIEKVQDPDTARFVWLAEIPVADIPDPVEGATLTTSDHVYTIVSHEPAGEGDIFVTTRLDR